jgi:hypothetical protein
LGNRYDDDDEPEVGCMGAKGSNQDALVCVSSDFDIYLNMIHLVLSRLVNVRGMHIFTCKFLSWLAE